jgi:ABC-type glycerol-3-phosphate transport system substrate-binding protein
MRQQIFKYYSIIVFALFLLINSSCQQTSNSLNKNELLQGGNIKKEKVKLYWMANWYGEGKKELLMREIAREFSLLNQDIDLQILFPQQVFKFKHESELFKLEFDSIAYMIKNNQWPWDVLFCDESLYLYAGKTVEMPDWGSKYLIDFSDRPWFRAIHKDGLISSYTINYGGVLPGPLLEGVTNILYVSEIVEKRLGIKVKHLDMSLSDFMEYAQAVNKYNQSTSDKITFLSTQYNNVTKSLFNQLLLSAYGKSIPATRQEGIEALTQTYEALEKLSKLKVLEQNTSFEGVQYDKQQRILKEDKFLFNIQPSWMFLVWFKYNPTGINVMKPCEIPSFDNKRAFAYSGFFQVSYVVPKNSKHPLEAERLIKFITSKEIAEKWIKYSKCPTGMKTNISYNDFGKSAFEIYYKHLQSKYGDNQKNVNMPKFLFETDKPVDFRINEVLIGKMTAEEALKDVQKQLR